MVDLKASRMLQLSFLLYIFPVIMLVIGAITGDSWGNASGIDPSAAAVLFGAGGFMLAIGAILLMEKGAKRSDRYKPVIIRVKPSGATDVESSGRPCH